MIFFTAVQAWCIPVNPSPSPSPSASPKLLPHQRPIPMEMQLPNANWQRIRGVVVRPVDGKLWYARTNGLMPLNSIVSIQRQGAKVNGGKVIEAARDGIFLEPWASDSIQAGDDVIIEAVAPPPP
ncbi:MAG: hypothetical protein KF760_29140 [Candidatus Eremiobacteraeota bacterium]|nr:hypothetical protein [Candidatus Eremiobacteraeota bacterium]MCW5865961.1 hypothetical protein [Candidatus Eremiobacteraeota bacterium]